MDKQVHRFLTVMMSKVVDGIPDMKGGYLEDPIEVEAEKYLSCCDHIADAAVSAAAYDAFGKRQPWSSAVWRGALRAIVGQIPLVGATAVFTSEFESLWRHTRFITLAAVMYGHDPRKESTQCEILCCLFGDNLLVNVDMVGEGTLKVVATILAKKIATMNASRLFVNLSLGGLMMGVMPGAVHAMYDVMMRESESQNVSKAKEATIAVRRVQEHFKRENKKVSHKVLMLSLAAWFFPKFFIDLYVVVRFILTSPIVWDLILTGTNSTVFITSDLAESHPTACQGPETEEFYVHTAKRLKVDDDFEVDVNFRDYLLRNSLPMEQRCVYYDGYGFDNLKGDAGVFVMDWSVVLPMIRCITVFTCFIGFKSIKRMVLGIGISHPSLISSVVLLVRAFLNFLSAKSTATSGIRCYQENNVNQGIRAFIGICQILSRHWKQVNVMLPNLYLGVMVAMAMDFLFVVVLVMYSFPYVDILRVSWIQHYNDSDVTGLLGAGLIDFFDMLALVAFNLVLKEIRRFEVIAQLVGPVNLVDGIFYAAKSLGTFVAKPDQLLSWLDSACPPPVVAWTILVAQYSAVVLGIAMGLFAHNHVDDHGAQFQQSLVFYGIVMTVYVYLIRTKLPPPHEKLTWDEALASRHCLLFLLPEIDSGVRSKIHFIIRFFERYEKAYAKTNSSWKTSKEWLAEKLGSARQWLRIQIESYRSETLGENDPNDFMIIENEVPTAEMGSAYTFPTAAKIWNRFFSSRNIDDETDSEQVENSTPASTDAQLDHLPKSCEDEPEPGPCTPEPRDGDSDREQGSSLSSRNPSSVEWAKEKLFGPSHQIGPDIQAEKERSRSGSGSVPWAKEKRLGMGADESQTGKDERRKSEPASPSEARERMDSISSTASTGPGLLSLATDTIYGPSPLLDQDGSHRSMEGECDEKVESHGLPGASEKTTSEAPDRGENQQSFQSDNGGGLAWLKSKVFGTSAVSQRERIANVDETKTNIQNDLDDDKGVRETVEENADSGKIAWIRTKLFGAVDVNEAVDEQRMEEQLAEQLAERMAEQLVEQLVEQLSQQPHSTQDDHGEQQSVLPKQTMDRQILELNYPSSSKEQLDDQRVGKVDWVKAKFFGEGPNQMEEPQGRGLDVAETKEPEIKDGDDVFRDSPESPDREQQQHREETGHVAWLKHRFFRALGEGVEKGAISDTPLDDKAEESSGTRIEYSSSVTWLKGKVFGEVTKEEQGKAMEAEYGAKTSWIRYSLFRAPSQEQNADLVGQGSSAIRSEEEVRSLRETFPIAGENDDYPMGRGPGNSFDSRENDPQEEENAINTAEELDQDVGIRKSVLEETDLEVFHASLNPQESIEEGRIAWLRSKLFGSSSENADIIELKDVKEFKKPSFGDELDQ